MSLTLTETFHVPSGYDPHSPILTFLHTSDFGFWEIDKKKTNDDFVMNLKRGGFGFVAGVKYLNTPSLLRDPKTHPTHLQISFRPTKKSTRITLTFSFPKAWKGVVSIFSASFPKGVFGKRKQLLEDSVNAEVRAMKEYVKEFHGLADLDLPGPE